MKNHLDNLVSLFNEKSQSVYEKIGGKQKGTHIYSMSDETYKFIYNKLQKKKLYKDKDGDVFVFVDGFIIEKTRPAICVPKKVAALLNSSKEVDKFICCSPASQLASFVCQTNEYSEDFQEILSDYKKTTHEMFKELGSFRLNSNDENAEQLNLCLLAPTSYIENSDKKGSILLPLISTQILERCGLYFFHSSFGMIHQSELTEEIIYNITEDEVSFQEIKKLSSDINQANQEFASSIGKNPYKKIELNHRAVICIQNGKTLELILDGEIDLNEKFTEFQNA